EGSDDGVTWQSYELRYEPGDVDRAPPFVAPHQPRVDFQMWFLLLGGRMLAPWFRTLLDRLLHEPAVVAPLFARDPFPTTPPPRALPGGGGAPLRCPRRARGGGAGGWGGRGGGGPAPPDRRLPPLVGRAAPARRAGRAGAARRPCGGCCRDS